MLLSPRSGVSNGIALVLLVLEPSYFTNHHSRRMAYIKYFNNMKLSTL